MDATALSSSSPFETCRHLTATAARGTSCGWCLPTPPALAKSATKEVMSKTNYSCSKLFALCRLRSDFTECVDSNPLDIKKAEKVGLYKHDGGNVALMIPEMGLGLEATVSSLWCSQFAFVRKGRTSFEYSCRVSWARFSCAPSVHKSCSAHCAASSKWCRVGI